MVAIDYLPAGVTYNSSNVPGTYDPATRSVTYQLGTMASGASQDVTIMVTGAATGTWDNRVQVRALQQDASPTYYEGTEAGNGQENGPSADESNVMNGPDDDAVLNNLTSSPYAILPAPAPPNTDIEIATTVSPVGPVVQGTPVTYTFTISNNGPATAPNVIVTDQLASSVLYQTSSPAGTLLPTLGIVYFNLGSLAAMGTDTVTVTVTPVATGDVNNVAIVRPGITDSTPPNNIVTNDLSVIPAPQVQSTVWYGIHQQPTTLAVTYNQPMDPTSAGTLSNYTLVQIGRSGRLNAPGNRTIPLRSVTYLASQQAVLINPAMHLNKRQRYALLINGSQPGGVRNILNVPLLDNQTFTLGGQYVQGINRFYSGNLVSEVPGSPFTPPPQPPALPSQHLRLAARHPRRG